MKAKLMLGLAAVALLASCGLIKTPPIVLQDTKASVTNPGGGIVGTGGALGVDGGKGSPMDLSKGGLVLQGLNTDKPVLSAQGDDSTSKELADNISRLAEWGFSQDVPTADLSGTACPESFIVTQNSFTLTVSDNPASGLRSVSKTFVLPDLTFKLKEGSASPCVYEITNAGGKFALVGSLGGGDLANFGRILLKDGATNTPNTFDVRATYNSPASVSGRKLTFNFGGSSSYVIATIL
jgi:hypothetical protein